MNPLDCKKGMKVYFGRENGQKTLSEVVKVNPAKAKVKTLEARGTGRGSEIGALWSVDYSALTPVGGHLVAPKKMKYNQFDENNGLYECLANVYNQLSPENLTADGELGRSQVAHRSRMLQRKLKGILYAIGREVDECEIMDWEISRREHERAKGAN